MIDSGDHTAEGIVLGILHGVDETIDAFIEAVPAEELDGEYRNQVMHLSVTVNNALHRLRCSSGKGGVTVVSGEQAFELFRRVGMTPDDIRDRFEVGDVGEMPEGLSAELDNYFDRMNRRGDQDAS